MVADDLDTDLLPEMARELVEVIGLAGTLMLIEHFGGTRLYVPQSLPDDHQLVALLGREKAEALCDRFGGDNPDIPRAYRAVQAALYTNIARAYANGASARDLARRHHCTERWIYYVVARHRDEQNTAQTRLFG
ncbi:MAG: Mor transcription activator family protein [Salinisphaeraceae bacterium]